MVYYSWCHCYKKEQYSLVLLFLGVNCDVFIQKQESIKTVTLCVGAILAFHLTKKNEYI